MNHNRLYENIVIVLPVVSHEGINNENDFPIDFNVKISANLKKKHEYPEQGS